MVHQVFSGPVRLRDGRLEPTVERDAEATLSIGPHAVGSFYRMFLDARAMTRGASAVAHAVALRTYADREA